MFLIFKVQSSKELPLSSDITVGCTVSKFMKFKDGPIYFSLTEAVKLLELDFSLNYQQVSYYLENKLWFLDCIDLRGRNNPISISLVHVDHAEILVCS